MHSSYPTLHARLRGPFPTVRITYPDSQVPPQTHCIRISGRGLGILHVYQSPHFILSREAGEISLYSSLSFHISYQCYLQMTSFHPCHYCLNSGLNSFPAWNWSRLNWNPSRGVMGCDGKWSSDRLSLILVRGSAQSPSSGTSTTLNLSSRARWVSWPYCSWSPFLSLAPAPELHSSLTGFLWIRMDVLQSSPLSSRYMTDLKFCSHMWLPACLDNHTKWVIVWSIETPLVCPVILLWAPFPTQDSAL